MGSYGEKTNLLEYLRSRSQLDYDSLDTDRRLVTSSLYLLRLCISMRCSPVCAKHSCQNVGEIRRFDFQPGKFQSILYVCDHRSLYILGKENKLIIKKSLFRRMHTSSSSSLTGRRSSRALLCLPNNSCPNTMVLLMKNWRWKLRLVLAFHDAYDLRQWVQYSACDATSDVCSVDVQALLEHCPLCQWGRPCDGQSNSHLDI